jgi:hypothetical protein
LSTPITLPARDVFEAVSAMLADVDDDAKLDIVVTISNGTNGARVAAFDFAGSLLAETDPIGRGNRWRNLLAVAPIGPDGTTEVIDIQTPHIGGILQFFGFDGHGKLKRVAFTEPYSTHSIGSCNLDLGIGSDADGDGQLDVLLPTQGRQILAVVTRDDATPSGTRAIFRFSLSTPTLTTNISAQQASSGAVRWATHSARATGASSCGQPDDRDGVGSACSTMITGTNRPPGVATCSSTWPHASAKSEAARRVASGALSGPCTSKPFEPEVLHHRQRRPRIVQRAQPSTT